MSKKMFSIFSVMMLLAGLVAACGSSGNGGNEEVKLIELLPASDEVSGWSENTDRGEVGPEQTADVQEATDWVNGAMDKFVESGGWVGLAREYYSSGDLDINLVIHEWSDAAAAAKGYADLHEYHINDIPNWTDVALGQGEAACRTGRVGSFYWYLNGHESKFLVEMTTEPASDDAAEQAAVDFATAVFAKIK